MTTFSAVVTNLTILLLLSQHFTYYVSSPVSTPPPLGMQNKRSRPT